jgi:hypothetical protein
MALATGPGARMAVVTGRGGARPALAVGLAAGQGSAAASAAGQALVVGLADRQASAAAPTGRTRVRDQRHDLRRDQPQGLGLIGPRHGRERDLARGLQQDQRGTGLPTSESGAAADTVPLDQVVTAVSTDTGAVSTDTEAVSMVAGVAFVAAGADGGPILGLSTILRCSAISTMALASTASFIMAAKEPMSGSSLKRCKLSCPMQSHVVRTAT